MGKKPKVRRDPEPRKQATTGGARPGETPHPVAWRLADADLTGEWGWRSLDAEHLDVLHRHLAEAEQSTLRELRNQRIVKDIPVAHICRAAQERLIEIGREEHDTLWELRVPTSDGWRAWGIVRDWVFYFLWWDPNHTVCGTGPPRGTRRR